MAGKTNPFGRSPHSNSHLVIGNDEPSYRLIVPAKRNWFIVAFLSFWLTFWTVGGFLAIASLFSNTSPLPVKLFLFIWLIGWAFGVAFAGGIILWSFIGKQVLEIHENWIGTYSSMVYQFRKNRYQIRELSDAELNSVHYSNKRKTVEPYKYGKFHNSTLELSVLHSGKKRILLNNLSNEEGEALLKTLQDIIPSSKSNHHVPYPWEDGYDASDKPEEQK